MSRALFRLAAGVVVAVACVRAGAVPPEVNNLRFTIDPVSGSDDCVIWDLGNGGGGYHVYRGDLASLPADYGACRIGSVPTNETLVPEDPVAGQAFFYLVTEMDEDGDGTAGFDSASNERFPSMPCIPARRIFEPVSDGDPGDGVEDGRYALRNPSVLARASSRDESGVYLHSGELWLHSSALEIPGRGMEWAFTRTYRSQVGYDGPFGHNWHSNVNARLAPVGSDVRHFDGAGRGETFGRIDTTHFASPPGRYGVLHERADGSFQLREPDGRVSTFHAFDGTNVQGVRESIEDRNANRITFQYDHQGLLTSTTDTLGRAIGFGYDAEGRITTVTDFAGRTIALTYDAAGDLVAARTPTVTGTPNGNDFPNGKTTRFTYSDGFADGRLNHDLLSVTWPNEEASGPPAMQFVYFDDTAPAFDRGRLESWTVGGTNASGVPAGGTLTFSYQSVNPGAAEDLTTPRRETTVTDRNGNQTLYRHNHAGNRISQTDFTNREVRPGESDYVIERDFNADGEIVEIRFPEGNAVLLDYDSPGLDRYREGNLLEVRYVADVLASGGRGDGHGGESDDRVWIFAHEPVFNRPITIVEPRGNDPTYVPQNGGTVSPARYTTRLYYDYEEGNPTTNGIDALAFDFEIDTSTARANLGDRNADGRIDQATGNLVRREAPSVALDPSSNQSAIEGDTSQEIVTLLEWNDLGQPTATVDAENNRSQSEYFPENDADGDGAPTAAPPDGRSLDTMTGGYLRTRRLDTSSNPDRNNKTDPTPADIRLDFEYDTVGNVTGVIDGRGVLTRYVVNELNQVIEIRRAAATADASGPDGDPPTGRGETGLAAFGFRVRHEYDANDNLIARRLEDRGQDRGVGGYVDETWTYDILDNTLARQHEVTTTSTLTTQQRYDANENLIEIVEPAGNAHQWTYDERDLLYTLSRGATGPRGGATSTWTWDYDGNRNPVRHDDARGNPVDYEYDGHDRLVRRIDQVGNTVEWFHDPLDLVVRVLVRGPVGGPTPADRSGASNVDLADIEYRHDELGRRFGVDRELFVPAGAAPGRPAVLNEGALSPGDGLINGIVEYDRLSRRTFLVRDSAATRRHDYDGLGRVVATTGPDGSTVERFYDDAHNLIEEAENEISSAPAVPSELFLTTWFHDAIGRATMMVDNSGQTTRYVYSSLDDSLTVSDGNGPAGGTIGRRSPPHAGTTVPINANGNVTRRGFDGLGRSLRLERVLTANGIGDGTLNPTPDTSNPDNPDGILRVHYQWDDNSLLSAMIDDAGNVSAYAYDNQNRRTVFTADDGTLATYSYDAQGNLTMTIDPNGSTATTTFNAANQATQRSVSPASGVEGTTLQTFEYDGLYRPTRLTDNNTPADGSDDAEVRLVYDSLSRVVEEVQRYGAAPTADRLVDLEWTAESLVTGMTYPSGRQIQYAFDATDRLTSVTDPARSESATFQRFATGERIHSVQYGAGLRVTTLDDAGVTDIGYDGVRRLTRLRLLDPSDTVLADFAHDYDGAGNRSHELRRHHPDPAAGGFAGELYGFDSGNRLIDFQEGPLDELTLTLLGPATDSQSWRLDGVGNWARMERLGTTYGFTANNLNEYDEPQSGGTRTDDGLPDDTYDDVATPTADGRNRAHDKNGNRTDDATFTYVYDFRNRLVRIVRKADGAPVAEYDHDAFDRRVFREVTNSGGLDEVRRYLYAPRFRTAGETVDGEWWGERL